MATYLIKRILMLIPLMVGITLITFSVIHLAPGEPVENQAGESSTQSDTKKGIKIVLKAEIESYGWLDEVIFLYLFARDRAPVLVVADAPPEFFIKSITVVSVSKNFLFKLLLRITFGRRK